METFITDIESGDVEIWEHDLQYPPETASIDREVSPGEFKVEWRIEMEMRSWGVKGISVGAYGVKGTFSIISYDEDAIPISDTEYLIDSAILEKEGWSFDSEGLDDRDLNDSIAPQGVEINYKDKSIVVTF